MPTLDDDYWLEPTIGKMEASARCGHRTVQGMLTQKVIHWSAAAILAELDAICDVYATETVPELFALRERLRRMIH